jgi:hypothetical protein
VQVSVKMRLDDKEECSREEQALVRDSTHPTSAAVGGWVWVGSSAGGLADSSGLDQWARSPGNANCTASVPEVAR